MTAKIRILYLKVCNSHLQMH